MSDPVSFAAAVVGMTVPALHGARLLQNDLEAIKDAPDMVQRLQSELKSLDQALVSLKDVKIEDLKSLSPSITDGLKSTVATSAQTCNVLRADLQRWTRHSEDGKMTWKDRTNVGFFKQKDIKAFVDRLRNSQLTICCAVNVATMYSLVQQTHAVEDVQKQVSGYQLDLEDAITSREEQLTALHCEIQKLRDMIVENGEEHTTQLKQLEEDRKALGESRKLLEELLAECHETVFQAASESHARTTTVTFGSHNSGFQSGIINGGVSGLTFGAR